MKCSHRSLALGFILVCFPLGVLAQPQNVPSTKGQYVPRPSEARRGAVNCPALQCRNFKLMRCFFTNVVHACVCDPASLGPCGGLGGERVKNRPFKPPLR